MNAGGTRPLLIGITPLTCPECEGFIHAKVTFVFSQFIEKARGWGAALITNASPLMNNYVGFIAELKHLMRDPWGWGS
uniref:Uncharacterized protein n=1 Tax=Electrophorus electricus TaxID=8005 RepID=A0AAY5EN03_ELEEL